MRVLASSVSGPGASDFSKPGVKACAFASKDGRRIVLNVANVQDRPEELVVNLRGGANRPAQAWLTSATETLTALPPQSAKAGAFRYALPPRGMLTVEVGDSPTR
jgi:hypothetical protein